jgi:hypothetical protein
MDEYLAVGLVAATASHLATGVLLAVTMHADVRRYEAEPLPWYGYPTVAVFWPLFLVAVSVRRWRNRSRRG